MEKRYKDILRVLDQSKTNISAHGVSGGVEYSIVISNNNLEMA